MKVKKRVVEKVSVRTKNKRKKLTKQTRGDWRERRRRSGGKMFRKSRCSDAE